MTSRVDVLSSRIEEVFTSGVPPWLLFFTRDPQAALDALFKMTYYHGRLNTMDPDLLLINWASAVKAPEFHAELDRALSDWITAEWEHRGPTTGVTDATWQYALRTIASLEQAPVATLAALRSRFEEAPGRIGMMTRNRAHDPIGWYWAALSRAQTDDWLVPHWFRLCNLVPGTPLFHGRWGLLGLRRAPNPSGDGPPAIAVSGLREFLSALNAQVEQHHIRAGGARMLAITECQAVLRANPTNAWRREMWAHLADLTAPAADWLPSVLGPRPAHIARTPNRVVPRADWAARAKDISGQLATQGSRALQPALRLLDEQREYNAKTGATYNLVRSLCVFSHTIVTRQPGQAMLAVRWADEARALEPWNAYTWTISSRARVAAGDDDMAISIAYESLDRFPEDVIVRCSLAEVLKAAGRLDESESVYRETQARFPGEPNVRNGLAEALKAAGRLDEAESVYRETLTRFPDEIKARNGLAEVLKAVHRLDEAEAMYRETVARFPRNEFALNGLAGVLKEAHRLEEAETVYRQSVSLFPDNSTARNGLAEVLKAVHRLDEAEAMYRETVARFPRNEFARNGLAGVLKAANRLEEAEAVYRESLSIFPGNNTVRNGLAGVLKAANRLEEAEAMYRESLTRHRGDAFARSGLAGVLKATGRSAEAATVYREQDDVSSPSEPDVGAGSTEPEPEPTADRMAEEDATALPPKPAEPSLRTLIRRAVNLRGEERRRRLEEVLRVVEARLAGSPTDGAALYAKLEALLALERVDEVESLLAVLPPYLSRRPEFLAMKGRAALARLNAQEPTVFSDSVVDSVVEPWEAASRIARELRHVPALQKLRVGTAMFDGADLKQFRDAATQDLSATMLYGQKSAPSKNPSRQDTLASWSLDCIRNALDYDSAAGTDQSFEELAGLLKERSDFFDSLEDELVSAVRHLFAPR